MAGLASAGAVLATRAPFLHLRATFVALGLRRKRVGQDALPRDPGLLRAPGRGKTPAGRPGRPGAEQKDPRDGVPVLRRERLHSFDGAFGRKWRGRRGRHRRRLSGATCSSFYDGVFGRAHLGMCRRRTTCVVRRSGSANLFLVWAWWSPSTKASV